MYKLFIVEDDQEIIRSIQKKAEIWGLQTIWAENFRNVLEEFQTAAPHLVIMDISLPYYNGYYWCAEIRRTSQTPILFLSSASDNMNMVMAMNMGADDFIAKPFDMDVLIAKIQAMLRRAYNFNAAPTFIEHKNARLNTADGTLNVHNQHIDLTRNEYRILLTLMENKGRVVSRERLMETLWKTDSFVDENTLTVNVGRLRKKLEAAGLEAFITTRFGVGYIVEE